MWQKRGYRKENEVFLDLPTIVPVHVLKGDLCIHRPVLLQLLSYTQKSKEKWVTLKDEG